jgi:chromosome segregation ATPase
MIGEAPGMAKAGAAKPRGKPAVKRAVKQTPRALVLKIYKTIDGELTKLEKQKGSTSQDRERASRALSQITSSLERAAEMQRELAKASSRGAKKSEMEALRHAEDMRRQIADRLERLGQSARLGKPAG